MLPVRTADISLGNGSTWTVILQGSMVLSEELSDNIEMRRWKMAIPISNRKKGLKL